MSDIQKFISHVAEASRILGEHAGVGGSETAGQIISYLAVNPDQLDAFMTGGTFAWPRDWFENGCLTWHAANGKIVHPSEVRAARAAKAGAA